LLTLVADTFESNHALADELKSQGIKTIVTCGIQTDMCVRSTSMGALKAGFDVIVLQGAHETYDTKTKKVDEIKKKVEEELAGLGAQVVPWEQWSI
jgi:nicotinamidase-related amidase